MNEHQSEMISQLAEVVEKFSENLDPVQILGCLQYATTAYALSMAQATKTMALRKKSKSN